MGQLNLQSILKALDKRLADIPEATGHEGKSAQFPNLAILWEESFFHTCALKRDIPVRDVMHKANRYVRSDDSLIKALVIILQSHADILPVMDNGSVIGVIRLEEIFKVICDSCNL